jgi:hypothetical protein
MNKIEKIAEKYIKSLGFKNIVFEPLGFSTFPDFAINKNTCVEVRKLNRNYINEAEIEADNLYSKYKNKINRVLEKVKPDSSTFYIDFIIQDNQGIIDEEFLFKDLKEYLQTCDTNVNRHKINKNLTINLIPCSFDKTKKFKLNAVQIPFFWVEEEYQKDIQYCIDDKQEKIDSLKNELIASYNGFNTFWLVLVDYLFGDDLTEYNFNSLNLKDFSKVIVIDTNAKEQKIILREK